MIKMFKRNRNENANHAARTRVEARRSHVSPFGASFNALRPLIS
ncbi:MAG: hypothetical protein P8Q36_00910 [Alphaproteobacteria bacterium]|jgi:hypothetical protein|nr:hypothetical protein [Alphaproteobacteria bacterium]